MSSTAPRPHRVDVSPDAAHVFELTPAEIWEEAAAQLRKHRGRPGPGRHITITIALDDATGEPTPHGSHVQPPKVYPRKP